MNKNIYFALCALTSVALQAALVVNETFDYDTGAIDTTATTGTGLTGNWAAGHTNGAAFTGSATGAVGTGSIPAPTDYALASTNNKFSLTNGAAYAQLATPIASNVNQTFYTSFLLDLSADGMLEGSFFNVGFAATGAALHTDSLNFGKSSLLSANFGSTYGGAFAAGSVVIDAAKNYFVVMKVDFVVAGNDSLSIKIFESTDTVSGTETIAWDQVRTGAFADTVSLTALGFRTGSAQTMAVDEIRIGDTWAAVAIPEPSTLILLGLSLGAVVLFRRKSR
jgi:hypothetical protein